MSTTAAKTTKDKIKDLFLTGQTLTSCGAAKDFVTADLRKIISVLRAEQMNIVDKWVKSKEGKKYKEYWLRKEGEEEPKKQEVPAPAPVPEPIPEPITQSFPAPLAGPSEVMNVLYKEQAESLRGKQQKLF